MDFVDIGPECFTDGTVISYKGQNYYHACDEFVCFIPNGGEAYCVKPLGHLSKFHESFDGIIRIGCPTCSGRIREIVEMVCKTCGTDYSTTPPTYLEPKGM